MFGKLIEEKIREAMEAGQFDNLQGKGKPINLEDYFSTPADLRLGYSMLKSAHCLPEEIELRKEIEDLKTQLAICSDQRQSQALRMAIESKSLKLNLLMDSNRHRQSQKA
ncbi:MAG: DUF1992 domain-containing protein [Blastocatellales bacterium]